MTVGVDPLLQFQWSVRTLAQCASMEHELYPSVFEVADALALERRPTHACHEANPTSDSGTELDPNRNRPCVYGTRLNT